MHREKNELREKKVLLLKIFQNVKKAKKGSSKVFKKWLIDCFFEHLIFAFLTF